MCMCLCVWQKCVAFACVWARKCKSLRVTVFLFCVRAGEGPREALRTQCARSALLHPPYPLPPQVPSSEFQVPRYVFQLAIRIYTDPSPPLGPARKKSPSTAPPQSLHLSSTPLPSLSSFSARRISSSCAAAAQARAQTVNSGIVDSAGTAGPVANGAAKELRIEKLSYPTTPARSYLIGSLVYPLPPRDSAY